MKRSETIKHTDVWWYKNQLRLHMVKELKIALNAYNGFYSWCTDTNETFGAGAPMLFVDSVINGRIDVFVSSIKTDPFGFISINCSDCIELCPVKIDFSELDEVAIGVVIDCMQSNSKVSNVTLPLEEFLI